MQYYIDVTISIVFVYLSLSIVTSIVLEFINTLFNLRGKGLRKAIFGLIDESGVTTSLTKRFGDNALTQSMRKSSNRTPSYLDSETYAASLVDSLPDFHSLDKDNTLELKIKSLPQSNIRNVLLEFDTFVPKKINTKISQWYDNAMDRFSGRFKRFSKQNLVLIGFVIAVAINADTFRVFKLVTQDASIRSSYVSEAVDVIGKYKSYEEYLEEKKELLNSEDEEQIGRTVLKARDIIEQDLNNAANADIFGWSKKEFSERQEKGQSGFVFWFIKLVGFFLTGLAVSMGGPFWFDILGKITPLGGKGAKPKKAGEIK